MRTLIVTEFITVDGVVEAPGGEPTHPHSGWVIPHIGPDQMQYKLDETLAAEALLVGRRTYEGFAAAWPERDGEFADKMNSMPKFVVSTTNPPLTWQNTTLLTDAVADVRALRAGEGGPILVAGSATLVRTLLAAGLVDELRLMVFPVVLGSGLRLFADDDPDKTELALADVTTFPTGVTVLTYHRAG